MFNLLSKIKQKLRAKQVIKDSDWGRRFGWLVEHDGQIIGELEYVRWDWYSQFWHEYRVTWRSPETATEGAELLLAMKPLLRNRHYTDFVVDSYLPSPIREDGIVAFRYLFVSEERICRDA